MSLMIKAYSMLTKPGIILGNLITTSGGFLLASHAFKPLLFLATALGLGGIIAAACVLNNIIDREADAKMERTQKRSALLQLISCKKAALFATLLGLLGTTLLALYTNPLATGIALTGFFFYVVMYSLLKYRSTSGTLIGSIAGAVPPVVGYTAVSGHLDPAALFLFTLLILWQMPHFYAIALYRLRDYASASIPVLPLVKGPHLTKLSILLYIAAFSLTLPLLFLFGYTGYPYLIITLLLSLAWLIFAVKGFTTSNTALWARQMFFFSLLVIIPFSIMIAIDHG